LSLVVDWPPGFAGFGRVNNYHLDSGERSQPIALFLSKILLII
jgi:hypothetical protein